LKKKLLVLTLSLGIVAFSSVAVYQSGTTSLAQPAVASQQTGTLVAHSSEATPEAVWGAVAKGATKVAQKAVFYAKEAYKNNTTQLSEVTRNASFWALGTETTSDNHSGKLDVIFDR